MVEVDISSDDPSYSTGVGLLFVFNLIVGTGALALPKAFQSAGYILGIILTLISCIISYACATFVTESMAIANASQLRIRRRCGQQIGEDDDSDSYKIVRRVEMSEMAKMFLGRAGLMVSYLFLIVYLFGDLSIYCTTVPKSIMNVICSSVNASNMDSSLACHTDWPVFFNRIMVYRIVVAAFAVFITPLVLAGITRTKYLQFLTTLCRWTAFFFMILLASISLVREGAEGSPQAANLQGFAPLFGITVYAFMCHHSLPGVITPMRNKRGLALGLGLVYILVLAFYLALAVTGSFAFEHVFDVYTLNFLHDDEEYSFFGKLLNYFLALFPVFTLTTNYPIMANTLGRNLNILVEMINESVASSSDEQGRLLDSNTDSDEEVNEVPSTISGSRNTWRRWIITGSVILIPMCIALISDNVLLLASITGSFPGVGVQFIIPSLLIIYARRYNKRENATRVPYWVSSPFRSEFWPFAIFVWSAFTILIVTLNLYHL